MSRFDERYITRKEHESVVGVEHVSSYRTGMIICGIYTLGIVSLTLIWVAFLVWLSKP